MDAWRTNENVRALALAPRILRALEELYGRKPLPFQTLNFRVGTEQPAHSDTIHFNSVPPGFMGGVWVPLEDIDMDNGPLVYYPGSHKLPEVTMQDVGVEPDSGQYGDYERFIARLIEEQGLEPRYATINKGQALIWSANILHGGAPQHDKGRTRRSQVTHYYFEGCKYWTPLVSSKEDVAWRDPEWIT
jgi:ectoine hydroxylase-related dioxygenase (phytanoyl-CoA dioxygenase family)